MTKQIGKEKLVVLLSRVPYPLEKGDKLRAYHQIKELSLYYDIYLCALCQNHKFNQQAIVFLEKYCKEIIFIKNNWFFSLLGILQSFFNIRPFQVGLFHNFITHIRINKWIKRVNPHSIYVQLHRMAPYVENSNFPKVIDFQDAFSMGMYRRFEKVNFFYKLPFWLEFKLLKRYELLLNKKFSFKTIISEVDKKWMDPQEKYSIKVVLNGVDFDFYKSEVTEKDIDILFTGNMGYMPNIDASEYLVNEIMPLVWKYYPTMKVVLAGANPHLRVNSLISENTMVTGFVDDLRPFYQRAKIFVAPMRMGSGLQNKLLEAMAMKVPCVTSNIANKSLKAIAGKDILVADDAAEFAKSILSLFENYELAKSIADSAFLYVSNFNWQSQGEKLHQLIQQSITKK